MPEKNNMKMPPLTLKTLIIIIKANLENELLKILTDNDVRAINILLGEGMRKFHLSDALGLTDNDKIVIISSIKGDNEKNIMNILRKFLSAPESGIAFTVDVNGFAGGRTIFHLYDKLIENEEFVENLKKRNPQI